MGLGGGFNLGEGFSLGGGINIGSLVGHVIADTSKWVSGLDKATVGLKNFTNNVNKFMDKNAMAIGMIGRRMAVVGAAITAGLGLTLKNYGEFERRMRRGAAVSEYTEEQFLQMSKMAEKASIELNIAATQAADAFYYLGSAGLTVEEQIAAFSSTLALAKAGVMDVGNAAENLVDVMKGMHVPFSETTKITDTLAGAVISSNMTFAQLGESLSLVASIAYDSHTPLNEVVAILGLMANAGIKGSRAGTALRRAFVNLMDPSKEMEDVLDSLGVEVYDIEGNMRSLVDVLVNLMTAIKGTTEEARKHAIVTIFGVRAITGIQAALSVGEKGLRDYAKQLKEAGGATKTVVEKQMKAFLEQMGVMGQEIKKLVRHIGATLVPVILKLGKALKAATARTTEWVDAHNDLTTALALGTLAIGSTLAIVSVLAITLGSLAIIAKTTGIAFVVLVSTIGSVVVGIGALVASIIYIITKTISYRKETKELKKEMVFLKGQITSTKEAWEIYRKELIAVGATQENIIKSGKKFELILREQKKALEALTFVEKYRREVGVIVWSKKEQEIEAELYRRLKKTGLPKLDIPLLDLKAYKEYWQNALNTIRHILEVTEEDVEKTIKELKKIGKAAAVVEAEKTSVFKYAVEERRRLQEKEFEDWVKLREKDRRHFTKMEYLKIQATQEALDTIEDSMATFFSDSIIDAENWKDAFVGLLKSIQRAMLDIFSQALARQIMSRIPTTMGNISGGLFSGLFSGLFGGLFSPPGTMGVPAPGIGGPLATGPIVAAAGGILPGNFQALASGGIVSRPTLGLIGEKGREAVVPLSGGRSIPVELKGAMTMPIIEVNVINKTSMAVNARRGETHFDSSKVITNVILTDISRDGPIRGAITGMRP